MLPPLHIPPQGTPCPVQTSNKPCLGEGLCPLNTGPGGRRSRPGCYSLKLCHGGHRGCLFRTAAQGAEPQETSPTLGGIPCLGEGLLPLAVPPPERGRRARLYLL